MGGGEVEERKQCRCLFFSPCGRVCFGYQTTQPRPRRPDSAQSNPKPKQTEHTRTCQADQSPQTHSPPSPPFDGLALLVSLQLVAPLDPARSGALACKILLRSRRFECVQSPRRMPIRVCGLRDGGWTLGASSQLINEH